MAMWKDERKKRVSTGFYGPIGSRSTSSLWEHFAIWFLLGSGVRIAHVLSVAIFSHFFLAWPSWSHSETRRLMPSSGGTVRLYPIDHFFAYIWNCFCLGVWGRFMRTRTCRGNKDSKFLLCCPLDSLFLLCTLLTALCAVQQEFTRNSWCKLSAFQLTLVHFSEP
jgi:hypothetical protein